MPYIVAAFYHFFDFPHFAGKRQELLEILVKNDICGSLLIAAEGFNGTIAGSREGIDCALAHLYKVAGGTFEHKESIAEKKPFRRTKVRLKKETISIGEPCPPNMVGEYVEAKDWNALIDDPDVIVIDTRNVYETHLGTFKGAVDPGLRIFKQLPGYVRNNLADAKDKKIATFCTGGIRCEKFTAWMKAEGFENVYHLKGGILKYLEEIPPEESRWEGECYVFDNRIAVGHGLVPSQTATMCPGCGQTLKPEDRTHPLYVENASCQFCAKNMREKYGVIAGSSEE
ncbi:MAG: rhodanese-related sulfurtransferase [Alphaproteobacteria bacterium]|nr:rhodanese-related sulfurtransferase [Alphaproteobacteria bacterium]